MDLMTAYNHSFVANEQGYYHTSKIWKMIDVAVRKGSLVYDAHYMRYRFDRNGLYQLRLAGNTVNGMGGGQQGVGVFVMGESLPMYQGLFPGVRPQGGRNEQLPRYEA